MGVYCTDRLTGDVFGAPSVVWTLLGRVLAALGAPYALLTREPDGYVPSWLAGAWGAALDDLGRLVVVARPDRGRPARLRPVAVHRSGSPAATAWSRAGEQLSVYDLPCAPMLLVYAQFCAGGTGHTFTSLRPAAPGSPVSEGAARFRAARSRVLAPVRPLPESRSA